MGQDTYRATEVRSVSVRGCAGDVRIAGHGEPTVLVTGAASADVRQEGSTITIAGCEDDLSLQVPYEVTVQAGGVAGDLTVNGVDAADIGDVAGDLSLARIGGRCTVGVVPGDLVVEDVHDLTIGREVAGDLQVRNATGMLTVREVGGDLELRGGTARCTVGNVGGDMRVSDVAELTLHGSVGGDLRLAGVREGRLEIGDVGGDLELRQIGAPCTVHDVGGDASAADIGDFTLLGTIGGDLRLAGVRGTLVVRRENVGGDLSMDEVTTASRSRPSSPSAGQPTTGGEAAHATRLAILQSLEQGEISAEEATVLLAHA